MNEKLKKIEDFLEKPVAEWKIKDLFLLEEKEEIKELLTEDVIDEIISANNQEIEYTFKILKEGFKIVEEEKSLRNIMVIISKELKELFEEDKPKEEFIKVIEELYKKDDISRLSAALTLITVFVD